MIEDTSVLARAKNLSLDCRVIAVRVVRGVRKGGQGTLLALGKEAKVEWDDGALVDIQGEGPREPLIPPGIH